MVPLSNITSKINLLLADDCYLKTGKILNYQTPLSPVELKIIEDSSLSRMKEFRAGRSISKEAAAFLGIEIASIPKDNNGCPLWPSTVVGSISHKAGFCGAMLGHRNAYSSIGLDIELVEHLNKDVWSVFASTQEIDQASSCAMDTGLFANLIFSAKEAFFKCLYPLYHPDNPSLSDINVTAELVSQSHIQTSTVIDNKKLIGNIVFDSRIAISWALFSNL